MGKKKIRGNNNYKKLGLGLIFGTLFFIVAFSTYQVCLLLLPNSQIFNKMQKKHNTYYTNDNLVEQNNISDNQGKEPSEDYKKGMKLLDEKDYYNACLCFRNVKVDDTYYNEVLNRIKECQQAFEQIKFSEAKECENKKDYKAAMECMDSILNINPGQIVAADSKTIYDNLYKEQLKLQEQKKVKEQQVKAQTPKSNPAENKESKNSTEREIDISKTIYICGGSEPKQDCVLWAFTNCSNKTIKNVCFYRDCGILYKTTESIKPNDYSYYKESKECYTKNNCSLNKVIIEYMDGKKVTIPSNKIKYLGDQAQLQLKIENKQIFVNEE